MDRHFEVVINSTDDRTLDFNDIRKVLESRLILRGNYTAEVIVTEKNDTATAD